METLDLGATHFADHGRFLGRFDAFCGRRHAQAVRHRDNGPDDGEAFRTLLRCTLHEQAIHLDGREPHLAQVAERGIAGPEIVQRDGTAQRHDFLERLAGDVGVAQEDAFGNLDLQPVCGQTAFR